ncbi:MAG: Hpt domain-containing protein [Bdellovibrionales bacterium]
MLKNVEVNKEGGNASEKSASVSEMPINLNALEQQLGNIDSMAIEMLSMFSEMTQPLMEDLLTEAKNGDIKKIRDIAHSLKGGARSAGAMKMGDIACNVQEAAENNQFDIKLIEKVGEEFERVKEHISELEKEYQR